MNATPSEKVEYSGRVISVEPWPAPDRQTMAHARMALAAWPGSGVVRLTGTLYARNRGGEVEILHAVNAEASA